MGMITDGCEDCEEYQDELDEAKKKISELDARNQELCNTVEKLESFLDEFVTRGRRLI